MAHLAEFTLAADLDGHRVLVTGTPAAARRAVRRFRAAGAAVSELASPGAFSADMLEGVVLVAAVDDGDPGWTPVAEACRARGVLLVREPAAAPGGQVTLVGGGPGSDGLMTVRARSVLREADVVFFDRLAPHGKLEQFAPGAELIDVGKRPGHHPVSQAEIEDLMIGRARQGDNVVRLKGGDPFVFGRGGEEMARCAAAGVPVSVVPGVSSAISVPAAAGIPVTYREISHLFTVVSGHAPLTAAEHVHLAGLGGTIVVLMGMGTLPQLVAGLRRAGMCPQMPFAVVEQGYRASQRTTLSTLGAVVADAAAAGCKSPAVLVIGEVVRLAGGDAAQAARLDQLAGLALS